MVIFPHICPACGSANGRRVIPQSPEVETFRCADCAHQWSAPAPPAMRPVPEQVLPRAWFTRKKR
jgi:transposase-like protein